MGRTHAYRRGADGSGTVRGPPPARGGVYFGPTLLRPTLLGSTLLGPTLLGPTLLGPALLRANAT